MKEMYSSDALRMANKFIEAAKDASAAGIPVLVFPHKNVDGDCIGSACATALVFRMLGASSYAVIPEELPENMSFLGIGDLILGYEDVKDLGKGDFVAVSVDCSEASRMGACGEIFARAEETLSIDHHEVTGLRDDIKWIEPLGSSACELVYYVCEKLASVLGKDLCEIVPPLAASCLMAGIVTDTGRFTYSNTRPETLETAGILMELGGNITDVCYNLFDRKKQHEFMASNSACTSSGFYADGKLAMCKVTLDFLHGFGASSDDVSDVVSKLRDVDGVELAIVLRETEDGKIRANLRSKTYFDCSEFAAIYGGGGHKKAAGFTAKGDIDGLWLEVKRKAEDLLCKAG
ncbi:MAG: DHH family phosphoesterase [Clostridiales bacterium]|nr:DHH family phosphoesterase [Clostridiales bacterium]